jgi:hypothetical protein
MSAAESSSSAVAAQPLQGDALKSALRTQLEFYFSRDNLINDAYLLSQMDNNKYVSVDVICNFRKVKQLTEDKALIAETMKSCKNMQLDATGTKVKPNIKMERNTLYLRDIPSNTPENEIKELFNNSTCPGKVTSIRSDVGDTWFVTFETEDQCIDAALWITSQTFQGKPVKGGVKSENLLRGFFINNSSSAPTSNVANADNNALAAAGAQLVNSNRPAYNNIPRQPVINPYANQIYAGQAAYNQNYYYNQQWQMQQPHFPPQSLNKPNYKTNPALNGPNSPNLPVNNTGSPNLSGKKAKSKVPHITSISSPVSNPDSFSKSKKLESSNPSAAVPLAAVPVGLVLPAMAGYADYMAAASNPAANYMRGPSMNTSSGYSKSFRQYTRESLVSVVDNVIGSGYSKPQSMTKFDESNPVFRKEPISEKDFTLLEPFPV